MKGVYKKDSIQKPIFIPYIDAHIKYGENMRTLVELLERDNGKWLFIDDELTFEKTESSNSFNEYILKIGENETMINEYYDKLISIE